MHVRITTQFHMHYASQGLGWATGRNIICINPVQSKEYKGEGFTQLSAVAADGAPALLQHRSTTDGSSSSEPAVQMRDPSYEHVLRHITDDALFSYGYFRLKFE